MVMVYILGPSNNNNNNYTQPRHSALVRSHQSSSLVASASCVPRGYNTRAQPCLKMWRGSPDLPAQHPRPPIPCTLAAYPEGVDVVL